MKTYTVVYERDGDGVLTADVAEVPGCHSYGRSLLEARRNILEALELWLETSVSESQIVEDWSKVVAKPLVRRIEEARALQAQVARLPKLRKQLADELVSQGFSLRDAGWIIGIAHQRIHQYAKASTEGKKSPRSGHGAARSSSGKSASERRVKSRRAA